MRRNDFEEDDITLSNGEIVGGSNGSGTLIFENFTEEHPEVSDEDELTIIEWCEVVCK